MEEGWREGCGFKKMQSNEEGRSGCEVERMKEEGGRSCVKVELKSDTTLVAGRSCRQILEQHPLQPFRNDNHKMTCRSTSEQKMKSIITPRLVLINFFRAHLDSINFIASGFNNFSLNPYSPFHLISPQSLKRLS